MTATPVKITWEELAKHNTEDDCWIAIRGKIYNITDWLRLHPGGKDNLIINGGRDATQLFECYHMFHVYNFLPKYEVGELTTFEYPQFPPMSDMYIEIKTEVDNYFKKKGYKPSYSPQMLMRTVALVSLLYLFFYLSVVTVNSLFFAFLFSALTGIMAALISFMPVHEGSHSAVTSNFRVWRLLGAIHDYVNGASFYSWLHQHFLGHHPFTNVTANDPEHYASGYSLDPDTMTSEKDIRRIKPNQEWFSWYKNQHIFVPMLYGLLGIKFRINDFVMMYALHKNGEIRINPPGTWHKFNFLAGKIFFVLYRLVLPAYYVGISNALWLFLVSDLITGWLLAFVFQVNHVIPQAKWPVINKEGNVDMDWALVQIETTMDYAHDSPITTFLTGALNYQVIHHLVPYVSQVHYPEIAPIVKQIFTKYDVQYNYLPTFWDAFTNHINYLKMMGHNKV
jgi:fatty acid desaturase